MNTRPKEIDLLILGATIVTMDRERRIYQPGFLGINNGKINCLGPVDRCLVIARKTLDASNMVVLPGLVNAHDHLDQSVYRGLTDAPEFKGNLLAMARFLSAGRAQMAASLSLLELVHYGVTTTHENHWTNYQSDSIDGICEAIKASGMRSYVFRGFSDKADYIPADYVEKTEDVLDDLSRLERKYDSSHIRISSEASTILRCSPYAVAAMREWAVKRGKLWHIHLAQTVEELDEALRTIGIGSVTYAEQQGVLGPEMLAAHCSGILKEELGMLGQNQVRIAHCPITQIRGGNRVPPIWDLERLGAKVAIGTDGSATNNGQNPWEAMKMAVYMQRVQEGDRYLGTAEQALEMMTIKAAHLLNWDNEIGSLEQGKQADVAIFSLNKPHLQPGAMMISNLVFSGLNNLAETVIIDGKVMLENGVSTVFDEERVIMDARQVQEDMLKDSGLTDVIEISATWPSSKLN